MIYKMVYHAFNYFRLYSKLVKVLTAHNIFHKMIIHNLKLFSTFKI